MAKHTPDRCSLGPTKGLEEKELLALAANKDLSFTYSPEPLQPAHADEELGTEPAPAPGSKSLPSPSMTLNAVASNERTLTTSGRWCGQFVSKTHFLTLSLVQCRFWFGVISSHNILVRMKISLQINSHSMIVCIPQRHVFLNPCIAEVREIRSCRITS